MMQKAGKAFDLNQRAEKICGALISRAWARTASGLVWKSHRWKATA